MIDIVSVGLKLLDKVLPDPVARDQAKFQLLQLQSAGDLAELKAETDLALEQIKVNAVEAASADPFVRRWRPAFGWLGVFALAYSYVGQPLLTWLSPALHLSAPPSPDTGDLMTLVLGLLGFGSMRTVEKIKRDPSV